MVSISRWRIILVVLSLVFGVLFALPNALPQDVRESLPGFMPKKVMNLGLDLQGGSYLLLEVDTEALRVERLTNMVEDVRTSLREEQILFSDLGVVNGGVNVRITDPTKTEAVPSMASASRTISSLSRSASATSFASSALISATA